MHSCQNNAPSLQYRRNGGVSLKQVIPEASFLKTDDLLIHSCCGNWNECRENDLFVALVSPDHDGHDDAQRAIDRGATSILGERMLPVTSPQCLVPDSRVAYGKICHALAGSPSGHLGTIGVSGTDGKTTTAHLIHSIFDEAGLTAGLLSSITQANQIRDVGASQQATTENSSDELSARPPRLANWISDTVLGGNRYAVIESSSVSLAQHHLAGIALDVAVLTNLRGGTFDFHGTLANYRRAQLRLLDYLKPTGMAVVNSDDPASFFALDRIDSPTITFGIRQASEIEARPLTANLTEQTFLLTAGRECVTVRTRMIGRHHIYNCLAAAAVAIVHEIDLATIARGIERVQQLPGRMNVLDCGQSFTVAVDQASTPYRLAVALKTLKRRCNGRTICVFSSHPGESKQTCGQFGRVAERSCDLPIVTLNRADKHVNYEPAHQIIDGFERPAVAHLIPGRIKAIEWALSQARAGDAVLIAGGGQRPITSLGNDHWHLTDRDVCESWLYQQAAGSEPQPSKNSAIYRIDDYR